MGMSGKSAMHSQHSSKGSTWLDQAIVDLAR
jgi:hypothetical protein